MVFLLCVFECEGEYFLRDCINLKVWLCGYVSSVVEVVQSFYHNPFIFFLSLSPSLLPQGTLKGYDQTVNIVLENSHERVYSSSSGVEQVPLGLYIIRGDNMSVLATVVLEVVLNSCCSHPNGLSLWFSCTCLRHIANALSEWGHM